MLLLLLQSEKETERKLIFRRSINPAKKLLLLQQALKCFFVIDIKKGAETRREIIFFEIEIRIQDSMPKFIYFFNFCKNLLMQKGKI